MEPSSPEVTVTKNGAAPAISLLCRSSSNASVTTSPKQFNGVTTPSSSREILRYEMTRVEQVARKATKSYVLDEKNALLLLAIPDHDEYRIMPPYSCRELTDRRKFIGQRDFVTRHNPQGTVDFKSQYSREVGTLARKRSVVSPPTSPVQPTGPPTSPGMRSSMRRLLAPTSENELWKLTHDHDHNGCWVLTDFGLSHLIGPEYRICTRLPASTQAGSPQRSLQKNAMMTSARKGFRVDLADDKQLASLSRLEHYKHSTKLNPLYVLQSRAQDEHSEKNAANQAACENSTSPYQQDIPNGAASQCDLPPLHPIPEFALEIAPSSIKLDDLRAKEVFLFPIRIRNVGIKQNRFRVHKVTARSGGYDAVMAEAHYDRPTGRLAAGLSALVTLKFRFEHPGVIEGVCCVETEIGKAQIVISGYIRV